MVASTDVRGNRAVYAHDAQGRIVKQTITDAATQQSSETAWVYSGQRLVALNHPTQSERYAYDERGLRTTKIVTLKAANAANGGHKHSARKMLSREDPPAPVLFGLVPNITANIFGEASLAMMQKSRPHGQRIPDGPFRGERSRPLKCLEIGVQIQNNIEGHYPTAV